MAHNNSERAKKNAPASANPAAAVSPAANVRIDAGGDVLHMRRSLRNPRLREAAAALDSNRPKIAQLALTKFLEKHPNDADALNLLAEIAVRSQCYGDAQDLLARSVAASPDFDGARFNYANVLHRLNKLDLALAQLEELLEKEPRNLLYRNEKAFIFAAMGRHREATDCYRELAAEFPETVGIWVRFGHASRACGARDECIAAYRRAIEISPSLGIAYSSLANLKTFRFTESEIDNMRIQLTRSELSSDDRANLHYALGKAYEDNEAYAQSFENYAKANAIRRLALRYDPDDTTAMVGRCKTLFTPDFFRDRIGGGYGAADPIFILGMHRSGSTLVEQMLSSHPAVEGMGELPDIQALATRLDSQLSHMGRAEYPTFLDKLGREALEALGAEYIAEIRRHRKLGRQFFTDKMPYNVWHVGFIHLILPNAKIIDTRRHPLGCCLSNFTMSFHHGAEYTYRQTDLGRCFVDYVRLMDHFDRVLPGVIHRVYYEEMVTNPEAEIRRLLAYLGLPFHEACLNFHDNTRAVGTDSSEQVRTPIFSDGVNRWRHYEPWLGPLKSALGPVLDAYPDVPHFDS